MDNCRGADLSLPVVLHHGQVFSQVFQADLELWVLCAGEVKQLSHQLVGLVSELGCLSGVGSQQRANIAQVLLSMFDCLLHVFHLYVSTKQIKTESRIWTYWHLLYSLS